MEEGLKNEKKRERRKKWKERRMRWKGERRIAVGFWWS